MWWRSGGKFKEVLEYKINRALNMDEIDTFFDEGELFFIQFLIYGIYYSIRITAAIFKIKSGRKAYSD